MFDLGASINVMPFSIYAYLNLGALKEIGVVIELTDRSNAYPRGVLEDVLVQVNDLVFPANFYVLDMENDSCLSFYCKDTLVQRYFELEKEVILVVALEESMECRMVENEVHHHADLEQTVASLNFLPQNDDKYTRSFIELPLNNSNMLPSVLHAPQLELKPLPTHSKYMFLVENETFLVIIANNLTSL